MENKSKLLPLSASLDDQNTAINASLIEDKSFQNERCSYSVLDCSSPQTFLRSSWQLVTNKDKKQICKIVP